MGQHFLNEAVFRASGQGLDRLPNGCQVLFLHGPLPQTSRLGDNLVGGCARVQAQYF
jgi:hypothetical protein